VQRFVRTHIEGGEAARPARIAQCRFVTLLFRLSPPLPLSLTPSPPPPSPFPPPPLLPQFGTQTVRLDVDCSPIPMDDELGEDQEENEEEGGAPDGYRLLVTVATPSSDRVMQVGCMVGDHLRIHRVTLFPASEAPGADKVFGGMDELRTYAGPNFDELDQNLQNAFYEYLAERGVDDAAAQTIADYCGAKEQTEYVNWLAAARDFAKGK
jgi:complement component 1 Q subcomponent-binding protein